MVKKKVNAVSGRARHKNAGRSTAPVPSPKKAQGTPPSPSREPRATSNGVTFGYHVQVKAAGEKPIQLAEGRILYPTWERAAFDTAPVGVPAQVPTEPDRHMLAHHHLFSYQAAQALRWWMHAHNGDRIVTRLEKVMVEYSNKVFDEGTMFEVDGSEPASEPKPDVMWRTVKYEFPSLEDLGWQLAQRRDSDQKGREAGPTKEDGTPAERGPQSSEASPKPSKS